ncbi:hypothetical protein AbraIFM66950_004251 [Aspergillus brasiliensis]|nr:hypothetical protein AbraIFM66950_004251 [Aspergillus brasiliensis]
MSKWQKLHISNSAPAPLLLYRYTLFRDGYELYLTDLTYIWSERPNRQHILRRAVEDDATIDPSQDIDQFNILLEKLQEALDHEPGTSTVLRRGRENDTLHLTTSTSLPAPLEPLKWNFYLSREKQRFSTTQLLIPLIKAEACWELRQRDLIEHVKRKDWLLSKLFDKLEAVGLDLSTIFPGIPGLRASHKGSTQSQAAKYISGARPFDEDSWLDENNAITSETGFASTILEETEDSTLDDNLLFLEDLSAPSEGWWRKMSTANNNTEAVDARTPEDSTNMDTTDGALETEDDDDDDDDDEFERQETPPRLRPQLIHRTPSSGPDEETATESEDDLDDGNRGPSTAKSPASQSSSPVKARRGFGAIGGNRKQPPQPESPQTSPASANVDAAIPSRKGPVPQADSDQTASETDDEDNHPSPSPSPPPSNRQTKPRGLGMIGGKKKEKQASPSPSPKPESSSKPQTKPRGLGVIGGKGKAKQASPPSSPPPEAESSSKPQAKPHGLGVIGGRKREKQATSSPAATATQSSAPPSPGPALDEQPAEPEKEETEEEKADRKREELKRQLEAKSKVPVKKKRKF